MLCGDCAESDAKLSVDVNSVVLRIDKKVKVSVFYIALDIQCH